MPDEQGMLTEAEQDKLLSYLRGLSAAAPQCELCHTSNWGVMPHVATPMPMGPITKWKKIYPVCMVACMKCGNTKFLNAVTAGIMSLPKEEPQALEEPEKKEEAKSG